MKIPKGINRDVNHRTDNTRAKPLTTPKGIIRDRPSQKDRQDGVKLLKTPKEVSRDGQSHKGQNAPKDKQ